MNDSIMINFGEFNSKGKNQNTNISVGLYIHARIKAYTLHVCPGLKIKNVVSRRYDTARILLKFLPLLKSVFLKKRS